MNRRAFLAGGVGVLAFFTGCISDSPSGSPNSSSMDGPVESPTSQTPTPGKSPSETNTPADEFFQIESKYTEPQKIIFINHQGIVDTRDISYRDSTRKTKTEDTPTEIVAESADQATQNDSNTVSADSADSIQIWNNSAEARSITLTIKLTDRPTDPLEQETYVGNSPKNPILNETYSIDPDAYITIRLLKPGDYVVGVGVNNRDTVASIEFATDNCNSQSLSIGVMPNGSVEHVAISTAMACMSVNTTTTAS